MFRWLPEQGSDFAHKVDYANYVVTDLSIFFTVLIVGSMLYFAVKYRKKNGVDHETPRIEGNNTLEVIWTVVPTIICVWVAWLGYDAFVAQRTVPEGAYEINVTGRKWAWDFEYKNGKKTTGEIVVPVGTPVKLVMTSKDVLHSFFIPVMRTKHDVIPGRYSYIWFNAIKTGDFQVFCTEYCGNEHSAMRARLKVLPKAEFDSWVNDFSSEIKLASYNPADRGKVLYQSKQCATCHSLDGSRRVGPSWLKLFGSKHPSADGKGEFTVDENYISDSIEYPQKYTVEGYPAGGMPAYLGQLSKDEIGALISFIKTLDGTTKVELDAPKVVEASAGDLAKLSPSERGKLIFNKADNLCTGCHSIDGSKMSCPTLKNAYGQEVKFTDGSKLVRDEAYIKESILNPMAKTVEGYGPVMPPIYANKFSADELSDLVEYIKSLK